MDIFENIEGCLRRRSHTLRDLLQIRNLKRIDKVAQGNGYQRAHFRPRNVCLYLNFECVIKKRSPVRCFVSFNIADRYLSQSFHSDCVIQVVTARKKKQITRNLVLDKRIKNETCILRFSDENQRIVWLNRHDNASMADGVTVAGTYEQWV